MPCFNRSEFPNGFFILKAMIHYSEHDPVFMDKFAEAAYLNNTNWISKRYPAEYANVLISDAMPGFWYEPFIGVECFVILDFIYKTRYLRDVHIVRVIGSKIHRGRSIRPQDIIML